MKIIRYEDKNGIIGHAAQKDNAYYEISGNIFGEYMVTDTQVEIVKKLAPIQPKIYLCIGLNYRKHAEEGGAKIPDHPVLFIKGPNALLNPGEAIELPTKLKSNEVDYECELAVIIGKICKNVSRDKALDYVLGYTCANDVSARDWQQNDVQWWRAKGSDTFGPVGPYIVSGLDYNNLAMELRVNGEVRQKTNTKNQIHDLATTISFISQRITLRPGDLIFTGTPGKTQGMEIGDSVEVEIQGVGILKNKLVAEK